jgi:hypothetical protein
MIGYWHKIGPEGVQSIADVALGAHVGGHELIVERLAGERIWRWIVLSPRGNEIEGGVAPDAHSAERLAEDAAFHIHPPTVGDWIERLM